MTTDKLEKLKQEGLYKPLTSDQKAIMKSKINEIDGKINWDKAWEIAFKNTYSPKNYAVTDKMEQATHWRALDDNRYGEKESVTAGKMYRLYYDKYDGETVLFDDEGTNSTIYLWHKGEWIIMEGSEQWLSMRRR